MRSVIGNERGSALIMVVVAMLILGILSVSVALLATVEATSGTGFRHQAQADALAEAALSHAVDLVRDAATGADRFGPWSGRLLVDGVGLGGGRYWARIDNDCEPLVPAVLQDEGCSAALDRNGLAVLTGWAEVGVGRSRARAWVAVDRPWDHVCARVARDLGGHCNELDGRNGIPLVTPADPDDPHGPAAFDRLPAPILGCSTIDPGLHGASSGCPPGSRMALMGEDPRERVGVSVCHDDAAGAGPYFGYFDCALQTPCEPAAACPGGATRACVRPGDTRLLTQPTRYREPGPSGCQGLHPGSVTGDPSPATGLVLNYAGAPAERRNPLLTSLGAPGRGVTIYVLRQASEGRVEIRGGAIHGSVVVEGNGLAIPGDPCGPGNVDALIGDDAAVRTDAAAYGYPTVLVAYDPTQGPPTGVPDAPQSLCVRAGTAATTVEGVLYSSGRVQLGTVALVGSVVASDIEVESGASTRLSHSEEYGRVLAPGGFRAGDASRVRLVRKSATPCPSYRDERAGATPCN